MYSTWTFLHKCPQLTFELSTKDIRFWDIHLHDKNHFTVNTVMLYGKDVISAESSVTSGTWSQYQVEPQVVNLVNQDDDPCEEEVINVKNMWECLKDHNLKGLGCALPWSNNTSGGTLCSTSLEYDLFHTGSMAGTDQDTEYISGVAKCLPGCRRKEYSTKLYRSAPDPSLQDRWQVSIFFAKDKFPVREQFYIYDNTAFFSDFGAYLGLLLGYSILTFYDLLFNLVEYISKKCNQKSEREMKRPKSGSKRPESTTKSVETVETLDENAEKTKVESDKPDEKVMDEKLSLKEVEVDVDNEMS